MAGRDRKLPSKLAYFAAAEEEWAAQQKEIDAKHAERVAKIRARKKEKADAERRKEQEAIAVQKTKERERARARKEKERERAAKAKLKQRERERARKERERNSRKGSKASSKAGGSGVKRAASAYILFSTANREAVKAANPDASFGELGRILGDMWRALSPEAKAPFEAAAAADKARYERDRDRGFSSGGGGSSSKSSADAKREATRARKEAAKQAALEKKQRERERQAAKKAADKEKARLKRERMRAKKKPPGPKLPGNKGDGSYFDRAAEAIAMLKDRSGSSVPAIEKYLLGAYPGFKDTYKKHLLMAALKKGVANGFFEQIRASYKLSAAVRKVYS